MNNLPPILPIGTQVVTRVDTRPVGGGPVCPVGIVGVVTASPMDHTHAYRVRCANDFEISVRRDEIEVLSHFQAGELATGSSVLREYNLYDCVIYRCIVGSRAYGLVTETSDTDVRGVYLAPAELHWSLYGAPEQLEDHARQSCFWELQKFLVLALKANPNVLECLYTPLVEFVTPLAHELLDMRDCFLSKLIYQTYNGYVLSQFKKIEMDLRNLGAIKWKHAMHLIRLVLAGIEILRNGFVPVQMEEHRERLLAIRRGEITWDEVNAWRSHLHAEFDAAYATTKLPDRPDYQRVNAFLIKARRSMVG